MSTARRMLARVVVTLLIALLGAVIPATDASAHATFVTSTPSNGDVLAVAPTEVSVELSEPVTLGAGYFRVLGADGERVDSGNVVVTGGTLTVQLSGDLPDGGYVATFRVVSADSHPVSGAIAFAVGDAVPPEIDSQGTRIGDASDDPVIGVLYPLTRWVGYLGLALLAGAVLLVLIDPILRASGRLRRAAWAGFDAALAATVLGGLLQGPYAAGRGVGRLFDPVLIAATLETDAGRMAAVRLMLLGILGVVLWEWFAAERDRRVLGWSGAAVLLSVAATHAASGHAAADGRPWLTVTVGAAHLGAAAAWVGGLLLLLAVVFARHGPLTELEQRALGRRFSAVATALVAIVVGTGVAEAWIRVGSWGALLGTSYGRLVLAKSALLGLALAAALASRRVVLARGEQSTGSPRRPILVEAVAGVAAIAVAAVLVATPPARDTYEVARDTQISFDNGYVAQASLDPARPGSNTLHVYLFDRTAALATLDAIEVSLSNDAAQIGPLVLEARNVGQGHFLVSGVELPAAGSWRVSVRFTEPGFGAVSAEGEIDVD